MSEAPQAIRLEKASREVREVCSRLFELAAAASYGLSEEAFEQYLLEVTHKYVPNADGDAVVQFLSALRIEELAITRGCELGNEHAWTTFMQRYRAGLYSAAYSIAKNETIARELADSLYAELFGIPKDGSERKSKLRYYMGRGSLEGWLRTVLAQDFVNRYRKTKNEVSLEEKVEAGVQFASTVTGSSAPSKPVDDAVRSSLHAADAESRLVLASYFLDGRTLAEIAKILRVHESTVSRKVERILTALKQDILKRMVAAGMSRRQAEEAVEELDVRDLNVNVRKGLQNQIENAFDSRCIRSSDHHLQGNTTVARASIGALWQK